MGFIMLRKVVGAFLIILGLLLIIPDGTEFINVGIGVFLSETFGFTMFQGILISFTLVPAVLIVLGAILMPGSTKGILTNLWGKIIAALRVLTRSPAGLIVIIAVISASYLIYVYIMKPYIETLI